MLVDKMKDIQLVAESKVLKIDPKEKVFSRFDKTVYIKEPIPATIQVSGQGPNYVEAGKFFTLFGEIQKIDLLQDYCHLTLKNGAEYKLPYLLTSWDDKATSLPATPAATIKLANGRLSSATLKNLANPMLQCIYVDDATAVSCNSMVACIDGTVTSGEPLILPPDIISLIEGSEASIYIDNGNYALKVGDAIVLVPIPGLDYTETAELLRGTLPENIERFPVGTLFDSLKRLSSQAEYVTFKPDRVQAGDNYEPFDFPKANQNYTYNIQNLLSVIQQAKNIAQSDYALLLYGDQFLFMISPEPTDDEEEQ